MWTKLERQKGVAIMKKKRTLGLFKVVQKPKTKREHKDYKQYVYTDEIQLDDMTTLVALTDEDKEFNKKVKEVIKLDEVYTYQQICKLLGEKPTTGNGKELQLSRWYQHMDWEHPINPKTKKPSKSFRFTNILDIPRQRIDTRQQLQHFKEQQLECNFIFSILNDNNLHKEVGDFGHIVAIRAKDLYQSIGLVNPNYYLMRNNKEAVSDFLPVEVQNEMYRSMEEGNKRYTIGALNRLKRAKVIVDYAFTYLWYGGCRQEHLATDEEVLAIENGIKQTLKQAKDKYGLELKSIASLYDNTIKDSNIQTELQDYMRDMIKQSIPSYEYYVRAYKVTFLDESMKEYVHKLSIDLHMSVKQLATFKLFDARTERTGIECKKIDKSYSNEPLTYDKATRLQRVVTDNVIQKGVSGSDKQLVDDTEFLTRKAEVNEFIKRLAVQEDYERIASVINSEVSVEEYELQRVKEMINEANDYMFIPITLIKDEQEQQLEYIQLINRINTDIHMNKVTSIFIKCNQVARDYLKLTLFINYKTKSSSKLCKDYTLKVYDMRDIEKLQAYLFSEYKCKITVGRNKSKKSDSDRVIA